MVGTRFEVLLHPRAVKALQKAPREVATRIRTRLHELTTHPRDAGTQLRGSPFWRTKVGQYRVIFEVDQPGQRVIVLFIGHRAKIYDEFTRLL